MTAEQLRHYAEMYVSWSAVHDSDKHKYIASQRLWQIFHILWLIKPWRARLPVSVITTGHHFERLLNPLVFFPVLLFLIYMDDIVVEIVGLFFACLLMTQMFLLVVKQYLMLPIKQIIVCVA